MTQYKLQDTQENNQELVLRENERAVAAANQNATIARLVNIVYFFAGIAEVLLAVRVVLHIIGANAGNGFANFIYVITAPLVAPFATLIQNPVLSTTAVLEITTIVAMLVYAFLTWLVGRLIWLALSRAR